MARAHVLNPVKLLSFVAPQQQNMTAAAYERFVAKMASSIAVQQLRAKGTATPSIVRNADRGAAAAAAVVQYDLSRDPAEYAKPIAQTIVQTLS